jgi:RNA polymerase sigma-70 factor (ECF subfamily)
MNDAMRRDGAPEGAPSRADEGALVARLRAGDEGALASLVDRLHAPMVRFARAMAGPGRADDVVQEAWLAFLGGLERYEGRSSLKTWLYGIVANKAKALAAREGRLLPASWDDEAGAGDGPSLPRRRFTFLGTWADPPAPWGRGDGPEGALLRGELRRELAREIETLPEGQRLVVLLRDVEGYTSDEVRDLLGIGDVNQRVLLHRGRSKLRGALESYVRSRALPPPPPSAPAPLTRNRHERHAHHVSRTDRTRHRLPRGRAPRLATNARFAAPAPLSPLPQLRAPNRRDGRPAARPRRTRRARGGRARGLARAPAAGEGT